MGPPPARSVSPGDKGAPNGVDVEPSPLYYLLIDGMNEMDSAAFGGMLQSRFKWKNLVDELDVDAADARRLVDAAHPFLLVRKIADPNGGKSVPVVDPCGECGFGLDRAWVKYSHDKPVVERSPHVTEAEGKLVWNDGPNTQTTYGRHTAYEQSARFVPAMLTRPRLTRRDWEGASHWSFAEADEDLSETREASIVYVSSHGWLGGFMAGDAMQASTVAEPDAAKGRYSCRHKWFLVGRESTTTFRAPLWIVLAQCSTLNSATWAHWTRMMAGGSPVVRGILGYEEGAPGAIRSTAIVKKLCDRLQAGDTFLDAWKQANTITGQGAEPWSAIVHVDAVGDTMQGFRSFKALTANAPSDLSQPASYKGYMRSVPDGEEVRDIAPKFNMGLWWLPGADDPDGVRLPVTAEHLARNRAHLEAGSSWLIALAAKERPDGSVDKLRSARLEMVHIRRSYAHQIEYAQLFDHVAVSASPEPADGALTHAVDKNVITVTCPDDTEVIMVTLGIAKDHDLDAVPNLQHSHSYVWWRVTLITEANGDAPEADKTHEFRMQGLGY